MLAGALAAAFLTSATAGQGNIRASSGDLVIEARELLSRGDATAAEARLRAALEQGVPRKAIAAPMGRALLAQDKIEEAQDWLEVDEFSPSTALEGLRALASLEIRRGRMNKAGNAYDRALAIAPDDARLWVDIARFRYVGGEHLLAIGAADHALALDPREPSALLLRAELVRDRQGMVPALGWFEKALAQSPADPAILTEYAATLGEAGEAVRMLAVTRKILAIDPGNPRVFYLQAVMAARAGNYWLARRLLERTRGRLDNVPGYMLLEGVVQIAVGNYALAIEALDPLVRAQPANRRARDLLARAMFLDREYTALIRRFAGIADGEGASDYLRMTVARAFEQQGERDQAAPLLDRVARVAGPPLRPVAQNHPIGELLAGHDVAGAREAVETWLAVNPGNYDHLSLAGDVALAGGDVKSALDYYARASAIRMPESLMVRRFQAMLMAGKTEQAGRLAQTFLIGNPASVAARRAVAWLAAGAGDWQRARRLLESLVTDGHGRDVQLLSDLALAQIRSGMPARAEATARQAYRLYPAHPVAAQAWGFALAAQGNDGPVTRAVLSKARQIMGDGPLLAQARTGWIRADPADSPGIRTTRQ